MKRVFRSVSLLLTLAILLCAIPLSATADGNALKVVYREGTTLSDIVDQLNRQTGKSASAEEWTYLTTGTVDYTYTNVYARLHPAPNWMDVTNQLDQYPQAKQLAERECLKKETADSAQSHRYVSLMGETVDIPSFQYDFPEPFTYQGMTASVRASIHGTIVYPAFDAAKLPLSVMMKLDGVEYTVSFAPAQRVRLVERNVSGIYQILAEQTKPDYASMLIEQVIDVDRSVFGDDPYSERRYTVTVSPDDDGTFVALDTVTIELGRYYRFRLTYLGSMYDDSIEVRVMFTDNREVITPTLSQNRIDVIYDSEYYGMEAVVYERLLTLTGKDGFVSADQLTYEYFRSFDYTSLLETSIGEVLKEQIRTAIAAAYADGESSASLDLDTQAQLSEMMTDEWLVSKLKFDAWVPFMGGEYLLTETIGGRVVTLARITLPAIEVGEYRIRVSYDGSSAVFPFGAESTEAILTIHPALVDVTVHADRGAISAAPVTQIAVSVDQANAYVSLPKTLPLLRLTAGKTVVDAGDIYLTYLREVPATLGAFCEIYKREIMSNPLLSDALVGDGAVAAFLYERYFGSALDHYSLSFEEPAEGVYFTFGLIGNRNLHADFALGVMRVGQAQGVFYATVDRGLTFATAKPQENGQHYIISASADSVTLTPHYQEIKPTAISPALLPLYDFDAKPKGEAILFDGMQDLPLGENDVVLYYNTETGECSTEAPHKAGNYLVHVYHAADGVTSTERLSYRFSIRQVELEIILPNIEITYGDALPEIVPSFNMDVELDYEIVIEGYDNAAGNYPILIRIPNNPGFDIALTEGKLTVNRLKLGARVDDLSLTYGDPVSLTYTLTSGVIPEGIDPMIVFTEQPKNAGSYRVNVRSENENIELTSEPGMVTIAKKALRLQIKSRNLLFGQEPRFETEPAWTDPDVQILYTIEGYGGKPGTYRVSAKLSDDTNYDVTFDEGTCHFRAVNMMMVRAEAMTVQWGDPINFKIESYAYENGQLIAVPTVGLQFRFKVTDVNGKQVDYTKPLEIGVYTIEVETYGEGTKNYASIVHGSTELTVVKKQLQIGVSDHSISYGTTEYNPADYTLMPILPEGLNVDYSVPDIKGVGEYPITVTVKGEYDTVHYEVIAVGGTLTVTPKPIEIVVIGGLSKVFGMPDPIMAWKAEGLIGEDTLIGQLERQQGEQIGRYRVVLGTLAHPNYTLTLKPAEFAILAESVTSIAITKQPDRLTYLLGEALDTAGMTMTVTFLSGKTEVLLPADCEFIGYDADTIGTQTVTVSYLGATATFDVTVTSGELTLNDERMTVEGDYLVIDSVRQSVTLRELIEALPEGYTATMTKNGETIAETARVGTSMKLTILRDDKITHELTVRVRGDVNGDGRLTQTDAVLILRYVIGKQPFDENVSAAADVAAFGKISQTDAVQILRWALKYDRA